MIRKLDELGRIVIPKEFRKEYEWENNCKIDIIEYGNKIILKKHDTKICSNCNNECEKKDKYCSKCGEKV